MEAVEQWFADQQLDPRRQACVRLLAGADAIGLLGHLTDVFQEAGMYLRNCCAAAKRGRPE